MKLANINTPFFVLNEMSDVSNEVLEKMKKEMESYNPPLQVVNMNSYQVDIENIDPNVPKAQFSTPGSACLDLYTRESCVIPRPNTGVIKIPLNVKIRPHNKNMYTRLLARSSTCMKYGLVLGNSVGIIDADYSDEVCLLAFCMDGSKDETIIPKGTKIAQLEFCIKPHITINETTIQTTDDHKGFGSTGVK